MHMGGGSARTRECPCSRVVRSEWCRPSVGPSALPSSGCYALFFYCRPQPHAYSPFSSFLSSPLPSTPPSPPINIATVATFNLFLKINRVTVF